MNNTNLHVCRVWHRHGVIPAYWPNYCFWQCDASISLPLLGWTLDCKIWPQKL